MSETKRVFALLSDASLRREAQRKWRANGITLVGVHSEGGQAQVDEVARLRPDVVVAEAEVDGAQEVIEAAARRYRVPVVTVVRTQQSAVATMRPLEWGAISLVPRANESAEELLPRLERAVHEAADAQVVELLESTFPLSGAFPDASVFDLRRALQCVACHDKVVAIGAGVGGPLSVLRILSQVSGQSACPIVYSQRISEPLLEPLVAWLQQRSGLVVQRAEDGQPLEVGHVYVASGNNDMVRVESQGDRRVLRVHAQPEDNPTHFDVLLKSVAEVYDTRAIGVLLSGRGEDGSNGILALRQVGGFTIVQDRASSLVYDRPGRAREAGGAIECLPINEIAERIHMLMSTEAVPRP